MIELAERVCGVTLSSVTEGTELSSLNVVATVTVEVAVFVELVA